jgi:hypothetical protein
VMPAAPHDSNGPPPVLRWGAFARLVVCRSLLAKTELESPGLHE